MAVQSSKKGAAAIREPIENRADGDQPDQLLCGTV